MQSVSQTEVQTYRDEATAAGAVDPMTLRFRVVEYDKFDGTLVGVPFDDLAFDVAVERTEDLIRLHADSEFCLQPTGWIQ